jgi:hypothetical protein
MMNRKRAVLASLIAVGVAIVSLQAVGPSAYAALGDCPPRSACLWTGPNYTGEIAVVSGYANYKDLPPGVHDNARSAASTTRSTRMCVFDWRNGVRVTTDSLAPGQKVPNLLGGVGLTGPDAMGACPKASGKPPECIADARFDQYLSSVNGGRQLSSEHSYVRVTWQPTFCQRGGRWITGDAPVLQALGAGSVLGVGVNFQAPRPSDSSVTYVGDVRHCIPLGAGYQGLSFTGAGCYTAAEVTLRAEVVGTSIRFATSLSPVNDTFLGRMAWTPDMK